MSSDEDSSFLEHLEQLLKNRFTEQDEEYMKTLNKEEPNPPICKIIVSKGRSYYQNNNQRGNNRNYHNDNRRDYSRDHSRHNNRHQPYQRNGQDYRSDSNYRNNNNQYRGGGGGYNNHQYQRNYSNN